MMNQNNIVVGGIALVVGILLGLLFAPGGASVEEIETALEDRLVVIEQAAAGAGDNAAAAVQPLIQGIDERLASVETAVSDAGTASTGSMEAMRSELAESLSSLGSTVSDISASVSDLEATVSDLQASMSEQTDALTSRIASLGESVAEEVVTQLPDAPASGGSTSGGSGGAAARVVETETGVDFVGIGAGQTQVFGDGALRAFVSRVDPDAGEVRMSVNGETMTMLVGDAVNVTTEDGTYCRLMLSGLQGRQVALNAGCGDELPAPEGARPGNVSLLADGAVRVFVSGIARDGSSARIAVNGTETETVSVGDTVTVETEDGTCEVTLDGIDRGHAAMSASCG